MHWRMFTGIAFPFYSFLQFRDTCKLWSIKTWSSVFSSTIHLCQHPLFKQLLKCSGSLGMGRAVSHHLLPLCCTPRPNPPVCAHKGEALPLSICCFALHSAKNHIRGLPGHEANPEICLMYFTLRQVDCNFQHWIKLGELISGCWGCAFPTGSITSWQGVVK